MITFHRGSPPWDRGRALDEGGEGRQVSSGGVKREKKAETRKKIKNTEQYII